MLRQARAPQRPRQPETVVRVTLSMGRVVVEARRVILVRQEEPDDTCWTRLLDVAIFSVLIGLSSAPFATWMEAFATLPVTLHRRSRIVVTL